MESEGARLVKAHRGTSRPLVARWALRAYHPTSSIIEAEGCESLAEFWYFYPGSAGSGSPRPGLDACFCLPFGRPRRRPSTFNVARPYPQSSSTLSSCGGAAPSDDPLSSRPTFTARVVLRVHELMCERCVCVRLCKCVCVCVCGAGVHVEEFNGLCNIQPTDGRRTCLLFTILRLSG